jgi:hypothetical protein
MVGMCRVVQWHDSDFFGMCFVVGFPRQSASGIIRPEVFAILFLLSDVWQT